MYVFVFEPRVFLCMYICGSRLVFFLHLLAHVARAAKRWSACQQGAGKRLVFNLVRADSIAWNCGREAREFVLASDFSAARGTSSISAVSSPFFSPFFCKGVSLHVQRLPALGAGRSESELLLTATRSRNARFHPFVLNFLFSKPFFSICAWPRASRLLSTSSLYFPINLYFAKFHASINDKSYRSSGVFMVTADL